MTLRKKIILLVKVIIKNNDLWFQLIESSIV